MKTKLGELLFEQRKTIGKPDGNNLDLIGVSNEIGLHLSKAKRIADLSRYKLIQKDWFAYNPMRINVGSVGYAINKEHIGIVSPDYVVFSCSEKIAPEYLLYLLKSDEGKEAIGKNASGAVRKRLYFSNLANIEIILPTIAIQKKRLISFKKIQQLSTKIKSQTSKESYLTQLKQTILQEAIQGKLTADWRKKNPDVEPASELLKRIKAEKQKLIGEKKIRKEKFLPPISEESPFELPAGWVWCRLGEILSLSSGDGLTAKNMIDGDIPVFGGNGINGYHNKYNTDEVTLTVGRVGAYCGVVHLTPLYAWITDNCFRVLFDRCSINETYFIWHLKYMNLGKMSYDGSQPVISGKRVYPLLTHLPPLPEQKAIVKKVESLMQKCTTLESEIKQSETHAKQLMQAVIKEAFEPNKDQEINQCLK